MKKCLLFLSIILISTGVTAHKDELPQLYNRLLPTVVTLHTFENTKVGSVTRVVTTPNGLGSGVLVSNDGLIVTAAHVVHTVDALHVEFSDGTRVSGSVISSVPGADLALVKVTQVPKSAITAKLAESAKVEIGERGFVIGAPLGINRTLTVGYISGKHPVGSRKMVPLAELFQTDAAINPGNSGGPLFNMKGEVIGIASHIQSQSGGSDGLGFAVTSHSIQQVLMSKAHFWSGLDYIPLGPELASAFQLPQTSGLLIQKVAEGSIAFKAGISGGGIPAVIGNQKVVLGGDIILSVNGYDFEKVENIKKIMKLISQIKTGDQMVIEVWRKGKRKKLEFNVAN